MMSKNGSKLTITFNGTELKGQVTSAELTWEHSVSDSFFKALKRAILAKRYGLPLDAIELQEPHNNPELS